MDRLNSIKLILIIEQPFFGYLLMHIPFKKDDSIENIGTDGEKIFYNDSYVSNASDYEIKFLIMHQVLHIVLFHVLRNLQYDDENIFHEACDLVVNSLVLESFKKSFGENADINVKHHINGREAREWTADQVYNMIKIDSSANDVNNNDNQNDEYATHLLFDGDGLGNNGNQFGSNGNKSGGNSSQSSNDVKDDHSLWKNIKNKSKFELSKMASEWASKLNDAIDLASKKNGSVPGNLKRIIKYLETEKIDWKSALRNFVETEVTDYSFNPPDKRYSSSDYLLPDFNDTEEKATGIFFFIDVSGSMSDEQVTECKAELRSCIKQYNGKVEGYLGYFDYEVSNLKSFDDEESMDEIESLGGGGTSFVNIFKYLDEHDDEYEVEKKKVIIMTDGFATFPEEETLNVDEVLWIINNDEVTPPFGEVIRI